MIEAKIVEKQAMTFVGREASFNHGLSQDSTAAQVIGPLWEAFCARANEIADRIGREMYGVIYDRPAAERQHPDELQYIAGVQVGAVATLPPGMIARHVPAATYAVFVHRGPIEGLVSTLREIYREWLPQSGFQHAGIADIELYDSRFDCASPSSEMEYWVSITAKGRTMP